MNMLEKWDGVFEEYRTILTFLEWCQQTREYQLGEWAGIESPWLDHLIPIARSNLEVLSEYFDIDQTQLERERRELLDNIRTLESTTKRDDE